MPAPQAGLSSARRADGGSAQGVIKTSFLEAQSAKSAAQKKTTSFLRRLVASVVDRAAHEHYGAAYSMKCLQTSHAVLLLLDRLKIGGVLCEGALCAALVYEETRADGWGGFWGANHHVWAMTAVWRNRRPEHFANASPFA
jgi:hypothetical protein